MTERGLRSAVELARLPGRREVSSRELLDHFVARIERLDGAVNAVVVRDFERARAADAALARGESWGPRHGLPVTVKKSFDVAGLRTTWGFEAQRDNVAGRNAVAAQRLVDAGAVVVGKTNVPAELSDRQSFNPVLGTTDNP